MKEGLIMKGTGRIVGLAVVWSIVISAVVFASALRVGNVIASTWRKD